MSTAPEDTLFLAEQKICAIALTFTLTQCIICVPSSLSPSRLIIQPQAKLYTQVFVCQSLSPIRPKSQPYFYARNLPSLYNQPMWDPLNTVLCMVYMDYLNSLWL